MQMILAERHNLLFFFPPAVQTLSLVGKLLQLIAGFLQKCLSQTCN